MCEPISIGIATAVVGGVSTIAGYQQQAQAAAFADQQAQSSVFAANRASEAQASFGQAQALFAMQQHNNNVTLANQKALNDWVLNTQQTNTANARIQREYLMAQQQQNYTDLSNQLQFQSQLNQALLSEERADTQQRFNQLNLNAQLEANQEQKNAAQAQRAFEAERLMVSSIQAQGSLLATGRSGQSLGLGVLNEGATYGRDMRMAQRNYEQVALADYYSANTNAFLQQAQADAEANASILPRPTEPMALPEIAPPVFSEYAPDPVFANYMTSPGPLRGPTYAPMPKASPGPSTIGLIAGLGSSALAGVTAGMSASAMMKKPPTPQIQPIYVA